MFGFTILSHKSPAQLLRLCLRLNELYGDPPIACHHDFSQCKLDQRHFPSNVRFVQDWHVTGWGKWSLIEATLSSIETLYAHADPEFFFLISGMDYPTRLPALVEKDLRGVGADAFIDAFPLLEALQGDIGNPDPHLAHHRAMYNLKLERDRYLRAQIKVPLIRWKPPTHSTTKERYPRIGAMTRVLPFDTPFSPFDGSYRCFAGSQWFTGNRKVAAKLLNPSAKDRQLRRYYRNRVIPDESYFQCVIGNAPELAYTERTFRFADWHGAHPRDMSVDQFDRMMASGAHFARKFAQDDPILDRIDDALGIGKEARPSTAANI